MCFEENPRSPLRRRRPLSQSLANTATYTGDLPSPIKYFNPEIKDAYKRVEHIAANKLLQFVPNELQDAYEPLFFPDESSIDYKLVKAADTISAYLKCVEELSAGNNEFSKASRTMLESIEALGLPEVDYFMTTFVPSFGLTLDELD